MNGPFVLSEPVKRFEVYGHLRCDKSGKRELAWSYALEQERRSKVKRSERHRFGYLAG